MMVERVANNRKIC